MMMLKILTAALGLSVAAAASASELVKGVDVTGGFTVGTEREWRGFNTGKDIFAGDSPGYDGWVEVQFLDGFYVNGHVASFGIGLLGVLDVAETEAYFSGGYRDKFEFEGTTFNYDVGATYHTYHGDLVDLANINIDWYEVYGSIGTKLGGADVKGTLRYSPEIFGLDAIGGGEYWRAESEVSYPFKVSDNFPMRAFGGLAYSTIEVTNGFDVDYIDWRAGLGFPFAKNFEARVYYVDTENLPAFVDTLDVANSRVVFELGVNLN